MTSLERIEALDCSVFSLNADSQLEEALKLSNMVRCDLKALMYNVPDNVIKQYLINRASVLLNLNRFSDVREVLVEFDYRIGGKSISEIELYKRYTIEIELCLRTGESVYAINLVEKALGKIANHALRCQLLVKKGLAEITLSNSHFSINALSDALAEAENVGDPILIASVCMELSRMFSFRYGALGIYFLRKAEVMLAHEKNAYNLNTVLMYRAMNSMQLYERNLDNSKFQPFKEAAEQAINSVKEELLHPGSDVAYFKRTKGYVMRDENLVGEALAFYQSIHSRPEILRTSEMYIGICLNKQLNDKAKSVLSIYKEAAAGDINRLKHAEELEANLAKYERIDFISPYDTTPHGKTTLLDILDHLALGEERWFLDKSIFRCLYPNYYHEGKFEAVRMPDGRSRLIPCDLAFNDYYRGQNKYVEESRPSLYRKGMTEADVFYERLKYAELKLLIQTYPMAQIYENGFSINFPDETSSPCFFEIDYLALAQHYGIKTELLDLTVDKFVAAFFACTDYHPETDSYTCKTENEGEGVFYHYVDTSFGFDMSNLRSVGLQPFSRPGEQGGFVLEMKPGENFNAMCVEAIHFEHNADIAKFIFNYTNRQKRLFPEGELEKKVSLIKGTPAHPNKVFSKAALALVRKELYETSTDEKIGEFIQKLGLTFREEPIAKFTESEKSDFMVRWKERDEKRFRDRVIVRFAYNGPVTFEGDRE